MSRRRRDAMARLRRHRDLVVGVCWAEALALCLLLLAVLDGRL